MINLMHGDCLELMKTIESGSVDLILTDPPYGTTACKWDSVIPFEPMWEQLKRIIKPNGAIVLFGSEPFSSALRMSNIKQYKYDWVYQKTKSTLFQHAKRQPMRNHENVMVFYGKQPTYNPQMTWVGVKDNRKTFNLSDMNPEFVSGGMKTTKRKDDGWRYPNSVQLFNNSDRTNLFHPTQKPVAILEYLIKTYTQDGETVLDFTMGSGSTGVAAKNLNRSFIGIELDETYFKIAKERISAA